MREVRLARPPGIPRRFSIRSLVGSSSSRMTELHLGSHKRGYSRTLTAARSGGSSSPARTVEKYCEPPFEYRPIGACGILLPAKPVKSFEVSPSWPPGFERALSGILPAWWRMAFSGFGPISRLFVPKGAQYGRSAGGLNWAKTLLGPGAWFIRRVVRAAVCLESSE
jgi:hypothetical protein